jgi:hypothetical protein
MVKSIFILYLEERRFVVIERSGIFTLKIPLSWKYLLIGESVHTFEDNDNSKKLGYSKYLL